MKLATFYKLEFKPTRKPSPAYRYQFEVALKWFRRVLRREPELADLRSETYRMLLLTWGEMGMTDGRAQLLGRRLRTIWNFATQRGLAPPCEDPRQQKTGPKRLPPPTGQPGTIVDFFWRSYVPQALGQASERSTENYVGVFRAIREWKGRDLLLSELSPELLAEFVAFLASKGRKSCTLKYRRGALLALWRLAHQNGELSAPPPAVRPIRVEREQPQAWSVEQVQRIVKASGELQRPAIAGVPAGPLWRALLLVAYHTALRRGSLLAIRCSDVDLETGWLYVPAAHMKNRVGQRFKLGPDAIEAIRAIYYCPPRERLFPLPQQSRQQGIAQTHFHEILRLAGVPKGTRNRMSLFHQLRRSTITHTAASVGVQAAIALAGHSGPAVNARYIDPSFLPQHDATTWLQPLLTV